MSFRHGAPPRFHRYHSLIPYKDRPMPLAPFFATTAFLFLAIVGGIVGIVLEGRRLAKGDHNPATRDTVYPIVGWAALFALYLAVEFVGAQNLTLEFRMQLGTFAVLPFYYAVLATAWLIWRSARRIHARLRGGGPVAWRAVPLFDRLAFPLLFVSAILSAATEYVHDGFSLSFFLLASVAALLALLHRRPVGLPA
jgi:hypothetical protein